MNNKRNRVTVPGKVIEQLYGDEEFYRDVTSIKKLSLSRFPKNDQWISEESFNMVFALAGYGPEDLVVEVCGSKLSVYSKSQEDGISVKNKEGMPKPSISHGVVSRGIARRSFKVSYFISNEFDTEKLSASMDKGLLSLCIPRKTDIVTRIVNITETK